MVAVRNDGHEHRLESAMVTRGGGLPCATHWVTWRKANYFSLENGDDAIGERSNTQRSTCLAANRR